MSNELTVKNEASTVTNEILSDFSAFENAQRIGKMLTQSKIIPANYQNSLPDVMVAMEIAARNKLSPIVVMQNLNVIKGRPAWSSKYIIAALTTSRVNNLHYEVICSGKVTLDGFKGGSEIENIQCRAIANDKRTGEERIGPWVSMKMAVEEGWYGKDGSKWKTMPEMMLRYRAATFFASVFYPELSIGIDVEDESATLAQSAAVVHTGTIVEPAAEESAKPKRAKKESKVETTKASEPEKEGMKTVEAEYEEVAEKKTIKPAPVVTPQTDESDEWESWED